MRNGLVSLQTLGCRPIASLDHFVPDHLGSADLVEEVSMGASRVVKVSSHSWKGWSATDPAPFAPGHGLPRSGPHCVSAGLWLQQVGVGGGRALHP